MTYYVGTDNSSGAKYESLLDAFYGILDLINEEIKSRSGKPTESIEFLVNINSKEPSN